MKRPSHLILLLAAVAILPLGLIALRQHLPYAASGLASRQPPPVVLSMENAYLVGLGRSGKIWSAHAESVEMAQNRYSVELKNIHDGEVIDKGKTVLKLSAGRADYNLYARDLRLSDGVLVEGDDGQSIKALGASWNWSTGILRSNGGVAYKSNWGSANAEALEVNLRNHRMRMWNGEIRARISQAELDAGEMPNAR